ncbi:MAG: CBS domain-containing protein [Gammaproteobacteria bacterium]
MIKALTARDCMTPHPITVRPDQEVLEAVQLLTGKRISGAPVLDQVGNLVGVLTEKDCLRVALDAGYHGTYGGKVSEYMSHEVATIDVDTPVVQVAEMFIERPFRRYPVTDGGRLVGVISRRNILEALET